MENTKICLFGGFSVCVNGEQKYFGENKDANFIKLFCLVILSYENGISRDELVRGTFANKKLLNETNSFNNLLHQVRSNLKAAGIPGDKYITGKKGIYKPLILDAATLDTREFEMYVKEGLSEGITDEKSAEYLEKAVSLYKGELLPEMASENWVIERSLSFKEKYDSAVRRLGEYYREKGRTDALVSLYERAVSVYPESGYQSGLIKAYILKGDEEKASELFKKIFEYYTERLGTELPDDLFEISEHFNIVGSVKNYNIQGAYYCTFSGFRDVFNVLYRNITRKKLVFTCLMLQTDLSEKERLLETVRTTLRSGDVYTEYGENVLVLLFGTPREDCAVVFYRIENRFRENKGYGLSYRIMSNREMENIFK